MKHYDYIEWLLYKENALSSEKHREMEDHLYICDECMDIFLSLISKKEVDRAEDVISSNFTDSMMNSIQNVKYKSKAMVKKPNKSIKDIFGYYVAVAAVAIVLTFGGFYSGLVDIVPQVAKSTAEKDNINAPNVVFNISQTIVSRTSNFINNFEISNREEERK